MYELITKEYLKEPTALPHIIKERNTVCDLSTED